jgi:preprotein translocase subunit YajC
MEAITQFAPFIVIAAIFYFLIIRPQNQRRKAEKAFAESLKIGDKVIMTSGIHGKVTQISEDKGTVQIETGAGKILFEKSAISQEMSAKLKETK